MGISATSLAAGVGVGLQNEAFAPQANNLPRRAAIVGQWDSTIVGTPLVENVPYLVSGAGEVGEIAGKGTMIHVLAQAFEEGSGGVPMEIIVQPQTGSQTPGSAQWTVAGPTSGGVIHCYLNGVYVPFTVGENPLNTEVADAMAAAFVAKPELGLTANTGGPGLNTLASISLGAWSNEFKVEFNLEPDQAFPDQISVVVIQPSGTGVPDIQDALDGMGTGDASNEKFFTCLVHGYGLDNTTLDKISVYNGVGNDLIGCYSNVVTRPFRSLVCSTTIPFSAAVNMGNGRKTDRTNGLLVVPSSKSQESTIAALAMGIMERINNERAAQNYIGQILPGVLTDPHYAAPGGRYTDEFSNRNALLEAGISPTHVEDGAVILQNVATFYHPDAVPVASNSYRSMRNISIIQNIGANKRANYSREFWKGISIVEDTTRVSNATDRAKTRDVDTVRSEEIVLAQLFLGKAWLYTDKYTLDQLSQPGAIAIRDLVNGFDIQSKYILSVEGGIFNNAVLFDSSIAITLQ
jgi:phage tail sheath gpL-like